MTKKSIVELMNNMDIKQRDRDNWPDQTARFIAEICNKESVSIYGQPDSLEQQLRKRGVPEVKVKQIGLILSSGVLQRYLEVPVNLITPIDINNMIREIQKKCALRDQVLRETTAQLLYGMGVMQSMEDLRSRLDQFKDEDTIPSLYIPAYMYDDAIQDANNELSTTGSISDENLQKMELLASVGIAKAQFLLGILYYNGYNVEQDKAKAISQFLKPAAKNGDDRAKGLLADDAYNKNDYDTAYKLYTEMGSAAMAPVRINRFKKMRSMKKSNKGMLVIWGVIAVCIIVAFIVTLIMGVNHTGVIGAVAFFIMTALLAVSIWHFVRSRPLKSVQYAGVAISIMLFYLFLMMI